MSSKPNFGASSRSCASAARNSAWPSSESPGISTVASTWPIFIAAPFISPSWRAICTAIAATRSSVARCERSWSRVRLTRRVPAQRRPCPATIPPTFAVRPIRPVRIRGESAGELGRRLVRLAVVGHQAAARATDMRRRRPGMKGRTARLTYSA